MKRILCVFFVLISLASAASAVTIGHRYSIPETDGQYSIEFPSYFLVLSKEMNNRDPAVTDFGFDPFDTMEFMKDGTIVLFAEAEDELNMSVFVERIDLNGEGFSAQDKSEEELEDFADAYAKVYFETNTEAQPANQDDLGALYPAERVNYVYWAYSWYDEGKPMFTEAFTLFEPDYMLYITFDCDTSDKEKYDEAYGAIEYICDSVIRDDTWSDSYEHL